jgi:hypothetical protein
MVLNSEKERRALSSAYKFDVESKHYVVRATSAFY